MARKKFKTTSAVNGVPHASVAADAAAAPITATDDADANLRWTSLRVAGSANHRTTKKSKKVTTPKDKTPTPKGRTPKAPKANPPQTKGEDQPRQRSALDAAAQILQETGQPMNCQQMIAAMAAKGYWTSPAGKTPAATLYSALLREIKLKGSQARFHKTARGHFVFQAPQAS
jgi:hypothetical protein